MNIIDLRIPDLRKVEVGTRVISSEGFEFELLARDEKGETWKDLTSGLTWLPICATKINHYDAEKLQNESQRLPTKEEFEQAEKHGFREVLDRMRDHWFWSSSVYPDDSYVAYEFYGVSGYIANDYRSDYGSDVAVRMVR